MGDLKSIPMPLRFYHGKACLPRWGWLAAPQVRRLADCASPYAGNANNAWNVNFNNGNANNDNRDNNNGNNNLVRLVR